MSNRNKLVVIVVIALVAITTALGFFMLSKPNAQPIVQQQVDNKSVLSQEYKNLDFGFSIKLPEDWKDYLVNVSESQITDETNTKIVDHVYNFAFTLPTTSKLWLENGGTRGQAFSISAFPKSELLSLQAECAKPVVYWFNCRPLTEPLAENNKYIFTYLRTDKITDYPEDFVGKIFEQADLAKATFNTFDTKVIDVSGSLTEGKVIREWQLVAGEAQDTCTHPVFQGEAVVYGWYEYAEDYVEKSWQFRVTDQDLYNLPVNQLFNGTESLLFSYYKKHPLFRVYRSYTPRAQDSKAVPISISLEEKLRNASPQKPYPITVTQFSQYCEGSGILVVKE